MRRPIAAALVSVTIALLAVLAGAGTAAAAARSVEAGNFYYLDTATGSTSKITVNVGDQLVITIVEGRQHSVVVDALGIDSGTMEPGQTFTTPVLDRAGTFRLYCRVHENKPHQTTLVVADLSAPPPPPAPTEPDPTEPQPDPTDPQPDPAAPQPGPTEPGSTSLPPTSGDPTPPTGSNDDPTVGDGSGDRTMPPTGSTGTGGTTGGDGSPTTGDGSGAGGSTGPAAGQDDDAAGQDGDASAAGQDGDASAAGGDGTPPPDGATTDAGGPTTDEAVALPSGVSGTPTSSWTRAPLLALVAALPMAAAAAWALHTGSRRTGRRTG